MKASLSNSASRHLDRTSQAIASCSAFAPHRHVDPYQFSLSPSPLISALQSSRTFPLRRRDLAKDARNLLDALSISSDLLGRPGVLAEEYHEYAADLKLLSDRSLRLIERLVEDAHVELSPPIGAFATVVPGVVHGILGLLSRVAGCAVEVSCEPSAFSPVDVPALTVERILIILVKNAAESAGSHASLSITVQSLHPDAMSAPDDPRSGVLLMVRDTGAGVSQSTGSGADSTASLPSDRKGIPMAAYSGRYEEVTLLEEDPSYSVASPQECNGGEVRGEAVPASVLHAMASPSRNVGLDVVHDLVQTSGGRLEIESEPGYGTVVSIEWDTLRSSSSACNRPSEVICRPERPVTVGWSASNARIQNLPVTAVN